jgi:hypothetical protein
MERAMSDLSAKIFRRMEDDEIRRAIRSVLTCAGTVNCGVLYGASLVRTPRWIRTEIQKAAREIEPDLCGEVFIRSPYPHARDGCDDPYSPEYLPGDEEHDLAAQGIYPSNFPFPGSVPAQWRAEKPIAQPTIKRKYRRRVGSWRITVERITDG